MEGDFYRKPHKRNRFRSIGKKLFKTRRRALITLGSAVLVVYLLLDNKGIIARVSLEMKRQEMAEKVRAAEEETKQLQANLKALQGDKKTIEKIARERHGMVREGETVWSISQRFGVPMERVLAANGLRRRSTLRPGQTLRIP